MLSQIFTKSKQYVKQLQEKPLRRASLIKQIIQSAFPQSWIYLNEILIFHETKSLNSEIPLLISQTFEENYTHIQSFTMLMFLYSLLVENRVKFSFIPWSTIYKDLCVTNNEIVIFRSWAFSTETYQSQEELVQSSVQMVAKHFPSFLHQNSISITDLEFDSMVEWILKMKTENAQKFEIAYKLSLKIRELTIIKHEKDYVSKEHLVVKKLFENAGNKLSCSGNAFLLLEPEKYFTKKEIDYFCHIYYDYLDDLNEQYLVNVFKSITIGGVTKMALIIIEKVSSLLAASEQFFKLRHIYQHFILPYMTRLKVHALLFKQTYQIISFYVLGFLRHCFIGQAGINYLLQGLEKLNNIENLKERQDIIDKWTNLILVVGLTNQLLDETKKSLREKGFNLTNKDVQNNTIDKYIDSIKIWNVTLRTGKKIKKYNKVISNFRGIQNNANECYIISVVQSLFFTGQLQKLLDSNRSQLKEKLPLLDQLRILFSQLQGKRKSTNIVITYLKRKGPIDFQTSNHQQDAMQYLIQLFDSMQNQCQKVPGMTQKMKHIFQINCQNTTKCLNCQKQTSQIQNEYIHTIPHTDILHMKHQQILEDYQCDDCHKRGQCKNTRVISPNCKIFIVHINRFTPSSDGSYKKQLSNQTILRQFLNYELVGMVCHIGKSINSGHYIYFGKIGTKTWVEMNDKIAYRFDLQDPKQEFQREMKADMSPYILFYKIVS